MAKEPSVETYSEEETERRREAALKVMLATPHKPHADSKKGGGPKPAPKVRRRVGQ
jgi:hypothetical protein